MQAGVFTPFSHGDFTSGTAGRGEPTVTATGATGGMGAAGTGGGGGGGLVAAETALYHCGMGLGDSGEVGHVAAPLPTHPGCREMVT